MKKLKNKVFYTIFGILTISLLSFIVVFNVQNYLEEKKNVERILNMSFDSKRNGDVAPPHLNNELKEESKFHDDHKDIFNENIRFMDATIYTVLLDSSDNIIDIINHSNSDNDDIKEIANNILKNDKKTKYLGSLYFNNYSYSYNKGNSLIIADITNVNEHLLNGLKTSLVIFVIIEFVIFVISQKITNWIIKPVNESFNKQKEFIADASHELKTPLSVIVASSEVLETNPSEKKWLTNIKNEADRMNNLITDLLELASSENEGNLTYTEGNLSKAVELSVLTFEGRAYEKKIQLDYDIEKNIDIKMNENSIRQVVEILLDNAIKHTKEQGMVKVSLKKNNNIELIVSNEGEPIPKGEEEKIFERFYRVDKSRNRKDNRYGLGLAIAKNIVLNHHGIIKAESSNGITSFKVILK